MRRLAPLVALALTGCAVGIGPVGFAIGKGARVTWDEHGHVREVRGTSISEEFVVLWKETVGAALDAALTFFGRPPPAEIHLETQPQPVHEAK